MGIKRKKGFPASISGHGASRSSEKKEKGKEMEKAAEKPLSAHITVPVR